MLQKKVDKHDLGSIENARDRVQYIRENPDQTYYQFHKDSSTIVFERDRTFVFATEDEVKTIYPPSGGEEGYQKFKENQVTTFIEM